MKRSDPTKICRNCCYIDTATIGILLKSNINYCAFTGDQISEARPACDENYCPKRTKKRFK